MSKPTCRELLDEARRWFGDDLPVELEEVAARVERVLERIRINGILHDSCPTPPFCPWCEIQHLLDGEEQP